MKADSLQKTKRLALHANLIALGVALGYFLNLIPNIELVTTTIFFSGLILGVRSGAIVGLITEFIYSNFNLFGPAPLHTLAGQLLAMVIVGSTGGMVARWVLEPFRSLRNRIILGVAGMAVTLLFDLLTTIPDALVVEASWQFISARYAIGAPYYVIHPVSNMILFVFVLPEVLRIAAINPVMKSLTHSTTTN